MPTMKASDEPLSLAEWVALCLVCEQPTHGFAAAGLLTRDSDLGQIWHIQKAVVYRALDRLEQLGYIRTTGQESSNLGPVKSPCRATPSGQRAATAWLNRPVDHPRDIRPELLLKLALLDRIGADPAELLGRQRALLAPIAAALTDRPYLGTRLERTLALWRSESISAALRFLDAAEQPVSAR